jgi:hypothetical protein
MKSNGLSQLISVPPGIFWTFLMAYYKAKLESISLFLAIPNGKCIRKIAYLYILYYKFRNKLQTILNHRN